MSSKLHEALAEIFAKDLSRLRALRDLMESERVSEVAFTRACWPALYRAMNITGTLPPAVVYDEDVTFNDPDSPEAHAEQVLNGAGFFIRADSRPDRFVLAKIKDGEAFLKGLTIDGVINAANAIANGGTVVDSTRQ